MSYALREALAAFRRAPVLTTLSAAMIGLSLFVVGLFGLGTHNIRRVLDQIESRVEIVAYIKEDVRSDATQLMLSEIRAFPEVAEVSYISREDALESARRQFPELRTIFSDLEVNPLPASIEVRLLPGNRTPEVVDQVSARISGYPFIEETNYGKEWVERIYLLRRIAGATALVVGGAFAAVAILIIGTAIRMAIFARRDEIEIMRLVGATDAFVRMPFLLEGILTGLLGGGFALSATYTVYKVLVRTVFPLVWLPDSWVLYGIATGGVLGLIASGLSVRQHLRQQ
jgi:cell division transport system permease protein